MEEGDFERFKRLRDERHKASMLETTERDKKLAEHPYANYIPHIFMSWSKRQYLDLHEMHF